MGIGDIKTIAFFSALLAIAFSLSFTGLDVFPQLYFFVFFIIAIAVIYIGFKKLNWITSKKRFLLGNTNNRYIVL